MLLNNIFFSFGTVVISGSLRYEEEIPLKSMKEFLSGFGG